MKLFNPITKIIPAYLHVLVGLLFAGSAGFAQTPQAAPVNPEFLAYKAKVEAAAKQPGVAQPSTAVATAVGLRATGLVPSPLDLSYLRKPLQQPPFAQNAAGNYPLTYDLRTLGRVTAVRDQGQHNVCWAFATMGSMESCLLPGETRDFSEKNLANLRGIDTSGDTGGGCIESTAYLARWAGPVNQSDDPYPAAGAPWTSSSTGLPVQKHVQQVVFIPAKSSPTDNDSIKQAIMTYGGLAVAINAAHMTSAYFNSTYNSYYFNGTAGSDHLITVVGWDDTFDSSKFVKKPAGNGAYIVKNSWGSSWADGGYFYASYYDTVFFKYESMLFNSAEPTSNYVRNYAYDPIGWVNNFGIGNHSCWGANLFTSKASESLRAVGFYATGRNTAYEIDVYSGITAGRPTSGTLASVVTGTIAMPGYYTIPLTVPANVPAGSQFSIVLNETTADTTFPLPIHWAYPGYSSHVTASPGQSYYSADGASWTDLNTWNATANFCIKGFTGASNANADLIGLTLSDGVVSPAFSASGTSYTANVPYEVTAVTVTPVLSDTAATAVVAGGDSLQVGANPVTVTVTARDGTTVKVYSVSVVRGPDLTSNPNLSNLQVSSGTLSPAFSPSVTSYTATNVLYSATSVTVYATPLNPLSTVAITGTSGLVVGSNTIQVTVTARDGVTTKAYTVTLTRLPSASITVTTSAATALSTTVATMNGAITCPSPTNAWLEWSTDSKLAGSSTSAVTAVQSGTACGFCGIATGLTAGTKYYFRARATNLGGSGTGAILSFTSGTVALVTPIVNLGARDVSTSAGTVSASANPEGTPTTVYFQYGTDTNYGSTTSVQTIGASKTAVTVSAQFSNLQAGAACHYRVVTVSALGTFYGADQSFTTDPLAGLVIEAVSGDDAPGVTGARFTKTGLGSPILNSIGDFAFLGTLEAVPGSGAVISAANSSGIWWLCSSCNSPGALSLLVRTGSAAPGTSGAVFSALSDPVLNDNDTIAFRGTLKTGVGDAVLANNTGLWMAVSGTSQPTLLIRANSPAAGTTGTFASFTQFVLPQANDSLVFVATLSGASVATANNQGVWTVDSLGTVTLIVRTGDQQNVDGVLKTVSAITIFPALSYVAGQSRSNDAFGNLIFVVKFTDGTQAIESMQ